MKLDGQSLHFPSPAQSLTRNSSDFDLSSDSLKQVTGQLFTTFSEAGTTNVSWTTEINIGKAANFSTHEKVNLEREMGFYNPQSQSPQYSVASCKLAFTNLSTAMLDLRDGDGYSVY